MSYKKNETDREIDQHEDAAADSTVQVHANGKTRGVGSPTGAGDKRSISKAGIIVSHNDKIEVIDSKAGKRRTHDSNPAL